MWHAQFPTTRMRRLRKDEFTRSFARESHLSVKDLVYPVFICEGTEREEAVASMPQIFRVGLNPLLRACEEAERLGVPAIMLFPLLSSEFKSLDAQEAYNPKGLMPQYIREIRKRFPHLGILTDVALDPYTTHGQDGVIDASGYILNDETNMILTRQALCHAEAGADIVSPSDMMDGRVGCIRRGLDEQSFINTKILAYSAKYASNFYSPFRDAVDSKTALGKADKNTYQMDPANSHEALREAAMDISEGADMVVVKPASHYLDIVYRVKEAFQVPTFVYQVSGEYAMLKAASQAGWIAEKPCVMETLLSCKRAGADAILTYYALQVAQWIKTEL